MDEVTRPFFSMRILDSNPFSTSLDGTAETRSAATAKPKSISKSQSAISNSFTEFGYDYFDSCEYPAYQGYEYDSRYALAAQSIAQLFNLQPSAIIYEVGCAKGFLLVEFLKLGYQVCGLDYSSYAISNCHPLLSNFVCTGNASVDTHPLSKDCDLIISKECLPHLEIADIQCALDLMYQQVSNPFNIMLQIQAIQSHSDALNIRKFDPTHKTLLTQDEWTEFLTVSGFLGTVHFKNLF